MVDDQTREKRAHQDETIAAYISRVREYFNENLNTYIGQTPRYDPETWEFIRAKAEWWMNMISDSMIDAVFIDGDGNTVTPEMIADWHFDGGDHEVIATGRLKQPINYISLTINLEDEDG